MAAINFHVINYCSAQIDFDILSLHIVFTREYRVIEPRRSLDKDFINRQRLWRRYFVNFFSFKITEKVVGIFVNLRKLWCLLCIVYMDGDQLVLKVYVTIIEIRYNFILDTIRINFKFMGEEKRKWDEFMWILESTFSWFWNLKSLKKKCNCSYFFRACNLTPDLTQAWSPNWGLNLNRLERNWWDKFCKFV